MSWLLLGALRAMAVMPNLQALVPGGAGLGCMLELDGSCSSWFLNLPGSSPPSRGRRHSEISGSASLVLCHHLISSPGRKEDVLLCTLLNILHWSELFGYRALSVYWTEAL